MLRNYDIKNAAPIGAAKGIGGELGAQAALACQADGYERGGPCDHVPGPAYIMPLPHCYYST